MQIDKIPAELRGLRQWVVWRAVKIGINVHKLPYNAFSPITPAKTTDPSTWADFDTAVQACANNSALGLGFVFTETDGLVGVDIDAARKVSEELREKREQIVDRIKSGTSSYMERSPSGEGVHIIVKGKLPASAHVVRALQIEMYSHRRFFTVTGDTIDGRDTILDEQAMLDGFHEAFPKSDRSEYEDAELGPTTNNGRRLDLDDNAVLTIAGGKPGFIERWQGRHSDWSREHKSLIGDLDKITGDPEQVKRLVHRAPLVTDVASKGGETRLAKSRRLFYDLLADVRESFEAGDSYAWYLLSPQFVADGKQIWGNILASREAEAKAIAERHILEKEQISGNARRLLDAFPQLRETDKALTCPPGMMGEIVNGIESMMDSPFTKFVIPGAFALVSGMIGRRYKLRSGGLNLFFILGAPPASGKSQVITTCDRLASAIAGALSGQRMGDHHSRVLSVSTSSIQAIHEYFMRTPSVSWFVDECKTLLDKMSNKEASSVDSALRDGFNRLYDASKTGTAYMPPVSMNVKKNNLEAIPNLNVSGFWVTTTDNVKLADKDVTDGFLSRVIVVRHATAAGTPRREYEHMASDEVMGRLFQLAQMAQEMDEAYKVNRNADSLIVPVLSEGVEDLAWELRMTGERIKNEALAGKWPSEYHMVSRIHMNAIRMAATMAVVQNPYAPVITEDQLLWSFGYILQNTASLLSDMEQGEIGATMSKDVQVVVREMKKQMRHDKAHGVKRGEFAHKLKQLKPFCDAMPSPGEAVKRTIQSMIENEMLSEAVVETAGRGRPAKMLQPQESSVWA